MGGEWARECVCECVTDATAKIWTPFETEHCEPLAASPLSLSLSLSTPTLTWLSGRVSRSRTAST